MLKQMGILLLVFFIFGSFRTGPASVDRPMIITMKWDGIDSHQNLLQLIPDFKLILQKIRDHLWTETETDVSETHVLESRFEFSNNNGDDHFVDNTAHRNASHTHKHRMICDGNKIN